MTIWDKLKVKQHIEKLHQTQMAFSSKCPDLQTCSETWTEQIHVYFSLGLRKYILFSYKVTIHQNKRLFWGFTGPSMKLVSRLYILSISKAEFMSAPVDDEMRWTKNNLWVRVLDPLSIIGNKPTFFHNQSESGIWLWFYHHWNVCISFVPQFSCHFLVPPVH